MINSQSYFTQKMEHFFNQIHEFLISTGLPPELQVFFLAMLPITELRAAIPVGITILKLPPEAAFIWGVIGNIIPMLLILIVLEPCCNFLMKHSKLFNKFLHILFNKTREKHTKNFERYGALFLYIFVAIPLPGSGGWTGTLIAFLFGINRWRAAATISAGIATAGLLITIGVGSITALIDIFT